MDEQQIRDKIEKRIIHAIANAVVDLKAAMARLEDKIDNRLN
jgi:hypothetical protein